MRRATLLALPILALMGGAASAQDLVVQFNDGRLAPQALPAYPGQRVITLPGNLYTAERVATLTPVQTTRQVIYVERPPRRIIERGVDTTRYSSDDPYDYRH